VKNLDYTHQQLASSASLLSNSAQFPRFGRHGTVRHHQRRTVAHQTTHRFGPRNDKALASFLDSGWTSAAQVMLPRRLESRSGAFARQLTLQGYQVLAGRRLNKKS
jgi:hypothetical protein